MYEKKWEKRPFKIEKNQANTGNRVEEKHRSVGSDRKDRDYPNHDKREASSFDKKRPIKCHLCGMVGHIKYFCTKAKKGSDEAGQVNNVSVAEGSNEAGQVNNVSVADRLGESFKPYLNKAVINGIEGDILRDSGTLLDICEREWVSSEDFTGEYIWLRQPLDTDCKCLPLAWVNLKGDFGEVNTKAAVKPREVSQGFYLLGNKTAELIANSKNKPLPVNLVVTRSQSRKERRDLRESTGKEVPETSFVSESASQDAQGENETQESITLPNVEVTMETGLEKVSAQDFKKEQRECSTLECLWGRAQKAGEKEFKVTEGRLIRSSFSKSGDERNQLCVPLKYRQRIISLCHEEIAGHLGVTKTKDRVLSCFFWPNCYQEIEDFVKTCHTCQLVGHNKDKKKAPMKLVPIISEPFDKINIDIIGAFKLSDNGNKYCLTSICLASKYPEAIPIKDVKSTSVIDALMKVFSRTGFPRQAQLDLGTSFTSELTSEFLNKFGVRVIHSSVCHPQSAPVERMHSSLKRVIKALCLEAGKDWEEVLPMALFALRTVAHESTGFSPAELVHGKNLRLPHNLVHENWVEKESADQNVVDYVLNLINRLKRCQELAEKRMLECRDKRKEWYDRNAISRKFKIGDQVLVLATAKASKMAINWTGPGVITNVISDTNYTIDIPGKKNKNTIYHVNLIKPYHKRPEYVNLLLEDGEVELDHKITFPYPLANPTQLDLNEMISNSSLENRATADQIEAFRRVIKRHKRVFSSDPGKTSLVEMDIILTDDVPVRSRSYRMSPRQTEILREEINHLLELGVIELGQSDYASPIILVESAGKPPRPCVDYRKLNAKTKTEHFPIPNIEEVVERVSKAKFISLMDLTKGYFQVPLTKRAQRYAAFITPFGLFLPKVMMFGLLNSGFYFCKLMAVTLHDLEAFALPYVDDVATFSDDWDEHMKHLQCVLERLEQAGLTVKPSKCHFAQQHVRFLGHEVGSGRRSPSEAKILAIKELPVPKTKTQLRAALGGFGYYNRYIKNYATIAAPLTDALRGKIRKENIEWNDERNRSFETLKASLTESPVLYAPDYTKKFILQTDASQFGAGIVLSQEFNGDEYPIVYLSKKFSKAEQNYSTVERELAAIVYGIKKLNHYLDGQPFIIQTDHEPLAYLKNTKDVNSRITRWSLFMQPFLRFIEHRPGKKNGNADALSRQA